LDMIAEEPTWNHADLVRLIYSHTRADVLRRYAFLALAKTGTRNHVLEAKNDFESASPLVRTAILFAAHRLGNDERKHWRRASVLSDPRQGTRFRAATELTPSPTLGSPVVLGFGRKCFNRLGQNVESIRSVGLIECGLPISFGPAHRQFPEMNVRPIASSPLRGICASHPTPSALKNNSALHVTWPFPYGPELLARLWTAAPSRFVCRSTGESHPPSPLRSRDPLNRLESV
jgi:hypothetical protein